MLSNRVSNPGPLTYESGALPIALRGPAPDKEDDLLCCCFTSMVKIYGHVETVS